MERAKLKSLVLATGCAEQYGEFVVLCDPYWTAAERASVQRLFETQTVPNQSKSDLGWLCIRTGGSSGGMKFARHDEQTIGAAVRGFCEHFGLAVVNAVGVLPPYHVSGLMARLRCAATGGEYVAGDWKAIESGNRPPMGHGRDWVISLVPTQLQRLLGSAEATRWLRQFRVVLLGGGPVWPALAEAAAHAEIPVSLSYGMTETAAMITASRPADFLRGDRSAGPAMPHAQVAIGDDGRVCVSGDSLFRGYFPHTRSEPEFVTEDLGRIDERGHLHLLGRRDAVIITGGKKVQPADVEAALRASGEFDDVAVLGVPDSEWGEVVVACYPRSAREPNLSVATVALAPFQRPKRFIALTDWPRNAQGKINRAALAAAVTERATP